jgi:hypothetical protein
LQVCIQVNVDGGDNKSGVSPQELPALAQAVAALPRLQLRGLMTIPEPAETEEQMRAVHRQAKDLFEQLHAQGLRGAGELSQQIARLHRLWQQVSIKRVETDATASMPITASVRVNASIHLGELNPDEVRVQLYTGEVTSLGDIIHGGTTDMKPVGSAGDDTGLHHFSGEFRPTGSGRRGFAVRIVPRDPRIVGTLIPGLITWDKDAPTVRIGETNPAKAASPVTVSTM